LCFTVAVCQPLNKLMMMMMIFLRCFCHNCAFYLFMNVSAWPD